MFGKIIPVEQSSNNLICRGIEVVITGLTRNQFVSNHTRVRIPPSAPSKNGLIDTTVLFFYAFKKVYKRVANRGSPIKIPKGTKDLIVFCRKKWCNRFFVSFCMKVLFFGLWVVYNVNIRS